MDIFFEGVYLIEVDVSVDIVGFEMLFMNFEILYMLFVGNKFNVECV